MNDKIKVTQIFIDAMTDSGCGSLCSILCEWCGRTHFLAGSGHGDYEEGELEELLELQKKKPDKYIAYYDDSAIGWGRFTGRQLVWGCPCNQSDELQKYEQFIWSHRYKIAKYLTERTKSEFNDKKVEKEIMERFLKVDINDKI